MTNFSSYDYLGLNEHPDVVQAAKAALDRYGISASASRHVAGERPVHRALERGLADHYGVEDCLVLVSGYGGPDLNAAAAAAGAHAVLMKPLATAELAQCLAQVMARARTGAQPGFAA